MLGLAVKVNGEMAFKVLIKRLPVSEPMDGCRYYYFTLSSTGNQDTLDETAFPEPYGHWLRAVVYPDYGTPTPSTKQHVAHLHLVPGASSSWSQTKSTSERTPSRPRSPSATPPSPPSKSKSPPTTIAEK